MFRKTIAALLVLALALTFTALAEEGDALSRIQESGKLVIATEGNWSPWTYHDENDELVGLDVEIGKLIAQGLGVEPEFQETDWDSILSGVDSGRFDIACNGVGYTETRAEKYSFTTPYVYTHKVLVVRADNEDIKTVDDLSGRTTANSPSSTYAQLAEEKGAEVTYVSTLVETIMLLEQGRVDATINAQVSINDYIEEHPDANIKVVQVLEGDPVAYPVRKGDDTQTLVQAIDEILEAARQDGTLSAISEKYFGMDLTKAD
ncbi:MAG: transporter substrate-binding domain-containing protein [Clostridiales bacterium]|nr:transporter substrate-binding domain-containing protein [Clostridiales bacterium]